MCSAYPALPFAKALAIMPNYYCHILNGDALKERFPERLPGELIVARECLSDGPVKSNGLQGLFQLRAQFLAASYGVGTEADYEMGSVREFEKMMRIPQGSSITLWFEDDLFCQVNFWFCTYLLSHHTTACNLYLARPAVHTRFGFGGLSTGQLIAAYRQSVPIKAPRQIAQLWESYSTGALGQLQAQARALSAEFPFIEKAVEAHAARLPRPGFPGRPVLVLQEIMKELGTTAIGPVFQAFCEREPIYGYGDLQVKRLLDDILRKPIE